MRRVHWICIALVLVTLLVYARVYHADFVNYDDNDYVCHNSHVLRGITWANVRWALGTMEVNNWQPLAWLSHMLDVQLFGLNPAGHHATSVIIHAITSVVLFLVLREMTGAEWRSAAVAALFAWHPLHVESVAWISERKDTLSALFFVLTIWAYSRYARRGSLRWYAAALGIYALALMSKPTAVSLPFVLLLLDIWPLRRMQPRNATRWIVEKIPFFVLAITLMIVTIHAQDQGNTMGTLQSFPLPIRIANALVAYATYIVKTFAPTSLAVLYPHPAMLPHATIPLLKVFASVTLLVLCTAGALCQLNSKPQLAVGWLWFIITVTPMIGLVQVGLQSRADRYTYLPLIGLFIAIAFTWPASSPKFNVAAAAIALGACLIITFHQTSYWANSITLFQHASEVVPNNYLAHYNVGVALVKQGDVPAAAEHFRASVKIRPSYADGHANLGNAQLALGHPVAAERELRLALQIDPKHAEGHNTLANMLSDRGDLAEAESHYRAALHTRPDFAEAHHNLALLLAQQDRSDEAIEHWQSALKFRPDYFNAHLGLAKELSRRGRGAEAISHFAAALQLRPDSAPAGAGLAWCLATDPDAKLRDPTRALDLARQACQRTVYADPDCLDALAAALAQSGRFDEAQAAAARAADIASRHGAQKLAAEISARAASYKVGRAFIMMPASTRPTQ